MRRCILPLCIVLVVAMMPVAVQAAVISINFSGGRAAEPEGFRLQPTDMAGNPNLAESFTANWNNANGPSGVNQTLVDSTGASTNVLLSYSTGLGTWSLPNTTAGANLSGGANPQMMRGYLDAGGTTQPANVTITGLSTYFQAYQVVIFFDGDNGTAWRVATFTITNSATSAQLFQDSGEDSEGVNFNAGGGTTGNENPDGLFQIPVAGGAGNLMWPASPNNDEGNCIVSTVMNADGIVINAVGTAGAGTTRRAPINGIQIIGLPIGAPTPTVTIQALAPAGEPATPGSFKVIRQAESYITPMNVAYTLGGTATAGTDYQALSGTVTIPANQTEATVTITPIDDGTVEGTETIVVTVGASLDYQIGSPGSATVDLADDDVTATVTVVASDASATETAGNPGEFTITRSGGTNTLFPLTVNYTVGGTATNAADYGYLSGTVVIPAGQSSATLAVQPAEDGTAEGNETVTVTITPNNPQYVAGAQNSATVTIADDGSWNNWSQSLNLVFAGYASEVLTNFPVLVVLTPERTGNYAGFAPDGSDIRFRSGDASLPYEIERWNPAGTSHIWVLVPEINSPTNSITLLWNHPAPVISAQAPIALWGGGDYVGVWHLNAPDGNGRYPNSTGTGSDGTNFGATPVDGAIGGALSFTGSEADYVDTGNTEQLAQWTVSVWTRSPAAPANAAPSGPVHREQNYQINWNHTGDTFRGVFGLNVGGTWYSASLNPLEANTWYNLVGTYDGETLRTYRNGVLIAENADPSGPPSTETNTLKFARHAAGANYFTGIVDEVQVLRAVRSPDWIANYYRSTADNFISYGGAIATVQVTASVPNAAEGGANGEITITRSGGALNAPLSVYFDVSGSAAPGKDYTSLPASPITLAGGQTQVVLPISALHDYVPLEGDETVVLTLQDRADYDISGSADATVTIADADPITNWQNKQRFPFGGFVGTTALTSFPVLIKLTPDRVDYSGFAAGGADIRFSDGDATSSLPFEIEAWDPNGTSLIWVGVPLLDDPRDSVVMYWGNPGIPDGQDPAGVWAPGHLAVHHFGGVSEVLDSTANNRDATNPLNSSSVAGVIGLGRGFNGAGEYADLGSSFLSGLPQFTLSGWINPAAIDGRRGIFGQNDVIEFAFNILANASGTDLDLWTTGGADTRASYNLALNEWHHIAGVGTPTATFVYIDGVLAATVAGNTGNYGTSTAFTVKIGGGVADDLSAAAHVYFAGQMDEVRMAGVGRSADWIANEYLSMTDGLIRAACGFPLVDVDNDGDVDGTDFGGAQRCIGLTVPNADPACGCFEIVQDGVIDGQDMAYFYGCMSAPNVPADPNCLPE